MWLAKKMLHSIPTEENYSWGKQEACAELWLRRALTPGSVAGHVITCNNSSIFLLSDTVSIDCLSQGWIQVLAGRYQLNLVPLWMSKASCPASNRLYLVHSSPTGPVLCLAAGRCLRNLQASSITPNEYVYIPV